MAACCRLGDGVANNADELEAHCVTGESSSFLEKNINGYWVEDPAKRENLSNFLYEMNTMYWVERMVCETTTWRNSQTMEVKDGMVKVHGIRGPLRGSFEICLKLDLTMGEADNGGVTRLGGWTDANAEIKDGVLIIYFRKRGTGVVYLIAEHIVTKDQPNVMIVKATHVQSGQAVTHYFDRQ